jgi:hypothetical protein
MTFYGSSVSGVTSGSTVYGTYQFTPDDSITFTGVDVNYSTQAACTGSITVGLYNYSTSTYTAFGSLSNSVAHQKLSGSLTVPAGQTISLAAVQAGSSACTVYPALAGITWQYKMAGLP